MIWKLFLSFTNQIVPSLFFPLPLAACLTVLSYQVDKDGSFWVCKVPLQVLLMTLLTLTVTDKSTFTETGWKAVSLGWFPGAIVVSSINWVASITNNLLSQSSGGKKSNIKLLAGSCSFWYPYVYLPELLVLSWQPFLSWLAPGSLHLGIHLYEMSVLYNFVFIWHLIFLKIIYLGQAQ